MHREAVVREVVAKVGACKDALDGTLEAGIIRVGWGSIVICPHASHAVGKSDIRYCRAAEEKVCE